MIRPKIKEINIIGIKPDDVYLDKCLDVYVTLEDDNDFSYCFTVTTLKHLSSVMDKANERFLEPESPFIIVRESTPEIIKEAIEAYLTNEYFNDYWFKFYYAVPFLTENDLDLIIERQKKIQAEMDKD
uniref:Uncharacterized protein n=1 Tax=Amicula sp. isolate GU52X-4 cfCalB7 TaxID=3003489 RepID=A0A9E8Z1G5_9STRA|nr:hypothetical protein [Amicula sp. isolate GU52X-4 cfCalB7]